MRESTWEIFLSFIKTLFHTINSLKSYVVVDVDKGSKVSLKSLFPKVGLFLCSEYRKNYLSPSDRKINIKLVQLVTHDKLRDINKIFTHFIKRDEITLISRSFYLWPYIVVLVLGVIHICLS